MQVLFYKTSLPLIELQGDDADPVEVLRTGVFTDRNGREVEITEADLDAFVTNFAAGTAGQDVPIDINHEREEAGGWVKSLARSGNKLVAKIDWNELGKQLVGDKVYRYMSATLDLANKVVKSISLVNFPAVKGLKPVELSEGVYGFAESEDFWRRLEGLLRGIIAPVTEQQEPETDPGELSTDEVQEENKPMDEKQIEELREQIRTEEREKVSVELKEKAQKEAELREQIRTEEREKAEAELKERYEKRQELVEFANEICGDSGVALSAKPEDVVEFLEGLEGDRLEKAKSLLKAKVVDFGEVGSEGDNNSAAKKKLPDVVRQDVLNGELTVKEIFDGNVLPGEKPDEYDLSEFNAEQKGF